MFESVPIRWGPGDYRALLARLDELAEPGFAEFSKKIIPTALPLLGVRVPALRALAKEIARGPDWRGFLGLVGRASFEETLLHGLVLAMAKSTPAERLPLLAAYLPQIDNWAATDMVASTMKEAARNRELYWEFLNPLFDSPREFEARFAVVMWMDYFFCDDYVERVLNRLRAARRGEYYVQMAVAWALSVCFVKYPEPAAALLRDGGLDDFTRRKALQKIRESRRVTPGQKAAIEKEMGLKI